jgi:type II secretory pathway pseudopilin PulG
VVATIGILSAIALPRFLSARQAARERAVVANLRTMATNQQLFYTSPVPIKPSSLTDRTPRFAHLYELNSYSRNVFGTTTSTHYVDAPGIRYAMVPLNPTNAALRGTFLIQATQQGVTKGFVYQVDESGRVVKIR